MVSYKLTWRGAVKRYLQAGFLILLVAINACAGRNEGSPIATPSARLVSVNRGHPVDTASERATADCTEEVNRAYRESIGSVPHKISSLSYARYVASTPAGVLHIQFLKGDCRSGAYISTYDWTRKDRPLEFLPQWPLKKLILSRSRNSVTLIVTDIQNRTLEKTLRGAPISVQGGTPNPKNVSPQLVGAIIYYPRDSAYTIIGSDGFTRIWFADQVVDGKAGPVLERVLLAPL